ncbi:MAG TPA: ABC transporter ATP-binding protein [Ramlibacter sp.]|nr:ABC transporter ATP-binding protein [Ramlibacter sp.]
MQLNDLPSSALRGAAPADGRIELRGVGKSFPAPGGTVTALANVNLTVRQGEFLCLVGPSGCGKTTVLRILAGLEQQTSGTVDCGIRAEPGRPLRSMVFQGHGVFPWMSVLDNAAYGLAARGVPKAKRNAIAREYLDMLGIVAFEKAWPRQLSGGMLQRVNLARAFANDPAMLLMDEPFGALDEQTKMLAYADLLALWERSRKTVVFITHNLDEAILLGDRVAVMARRPGRIKDIVEVKLPRPRDVLELQNEPEYVAVRRRIWDSLRSEVLSLRSELEQARSTA